MRIAMLGHKRYGSREGGVEVVVTELARRMVARGHEVTCYDRGGRDVATGAAVQAGERVVDGVRVVTAPTVDARGLAALTSAVSATRMALRERPDVIHFHAEGPCVALPMAARAGVPTVATIHGLDWQRAKWGRLGRATIMRGERAAARHAGEVIVLSEAAREYFMATYGRETTLVPNGVTMPGPAPAAEISRRWGLAGGSYVLYLGRIVPEKRVELLVEAFRGLDTDRRLVVAGASSDTDAYAAEVRRLAGADPRVLMAGHVEGQTLAELYSNAAAYVLPSDVEGMPLSLLEAMSYGLPCVTSDIPECAGVLAGAGVTFPAGEATALRDALAGLLADPAWAAKLGGEARTRVAAEHDWDRVVGRTLAVYESAIAARGRAAHRAGRLEVGEAS